MTDAQEARNAAPATPQAAPISTEPAAAAPAQAATPRQRTRDPGRGAGKRRKPAGSQAPTAAAAQAGAADAGADTAPERIDAVLEQLASLYPQLFGAVFRPLKRGIFDELLAAHPDVFERDALKLALGLHTRSTRYLHSVAAGDKRHDLQGRPVEDMALEHAHHALLTVYHRRQARSAEDLRPWLHQRMLAAFEASGLTRTAYAERLQSRDATANAILEQVFAEHAARSARDEALLRAFSASGQTLQAFADMYGMQPHTVAQQLERARRSSASQD